MPVIHTFDPPERFVAGTVGEPGSRVFFLQARSGSRLVSVALEKQQVAALAERIDELLDNLMTEESTVVIPAVAPVGTEDGAPLDQPIEEDFRAGTMTLSWDPDDARVVIEVFAVTEVETVGIEGLDEDDDSSSPEDLAEEMMLVRLPPATARAFVKRAGQVVQAGRPSCPFCGQPVSPDGHLCVRANGFRRRAP